MKRFLASPWTWCVLVTLDATAGSDARTLAGRWWMWSLAGICCLNLLHAAKGKWWD